VVAERHDVRTRCEQLLRELRRDAGTVGDVLTVDDAGVGAELFAQARETLLDRPPARGAEDVGKEEDSQLRTSAAAGRTSIDT
jgi:hypothetical protein